MRLLNLVQQNDAVWAAAYLFCQLTTFVVTDIPRRATEQTSNRMRLHVLRHVKADQVCFTTKELGRQGLRQFRLTYTRWAKEEERANRALWILQASTRATNGTSNGADRLVLTNDTLAQVFFQVPQVLTLGLKHLAHRYTRPVLNNLRYLLRRNNQG